MQTRRMKALLLTAALVCLLSGTTKSFAIPQTINGILNGQNGQSLPLEEWLREAKHWLKEAELPGTWTASSSDGKVFEHASPGAVFGVVASFATITKAADGDIKQVVVRYPSTKDSQALVNRLTTAVALFQSNRSWEKTVAGMLNKGGDLAVLIQRDAKSGDVSVVLTRAVH